MVRRELDADEYLFRDLHVQKRENVPEVSRGTNSTPYQSGLIGGMTSGNYCTFILGARSSLVVQLHRRNRIDSISVCQR